MAVCSCVTCSRGYQSRQTIDDPNLPASTTPFPDSTITTSAHTPPGSSEADSIVNITGESGSESSRHKVNTPIMDSKVAATKKRKRSTKSIQSSSTSLPRPIKIDFPRLVTEPTKRALDVLQTLCDGYRPSSAWTTFSFDAEQLDELEDILDPKNGRLGGWAGDKLYRDYETSQSEYIIRAPSPLAHNFGIYFAEEISAKIQALTRQLVLDTTQAEMSRRVGEIRKSYFRTFRSGNRDTTCPDAVFSSADNERTLAIEVGEPDKKDSLRKLAEKHLTRVNTVITIDLDFQRQSVYPRSNERIYRKASYSIYRKLEWCGSQVLDFHVQHHDFLLEDATAPVPDGSMNLTVSDFFHYYTEHDMVDLKDNHKISISHEELNKILLKCEADVRPQPEDRLRSRGRASIRFTYHNAETAAGETPLEEELPLLI